MALITLGYSGTTNCITRQFDRLGRKTNILDATGTHALIYDPVCNWRLPGGAGGKMEGSR